MHRVYLGENRHPGTTHFERLFAYDHLPPKLREVSMPFAQLAMYMADVAADGPELTACLRKLLEAKDCAVRALMLSE